MLMHLGQKVDQCLTVVGARTQLEDEVGSPAIGFVRQDAGSATYSSTSALSAQQHVSGTLGTSASRFNLSASGSP